MTASPEPSAPDRESPHSSGAPEGAGVGSRPTQAPAGTAPVAGRIPDFFIVGHEKSGTTSLYKMLRGHPQIFMPDLKEPRYFVTDRRAEGAENEGALPRTLEDYLALFAAAAPEQRAGEASPQYLRSKEAAGLIAEVQPAARIIAILREPTSF